MRQNASLKKTLYASIAMAPCCYCNVVFLIDNLTIEHITPRCLGGTNDSNNIALACAPCNLERGRNVFLIRKKIMKDYYKEIRNGR